EAARFDDRPSAWLAAMARRAMIRGGGEIEPHDLAFGSTWMKLSQYLLRPDWRFRLAQFRADMMNGDDRLLLMVPGRMNFLFPLLRIPLWAWHRAAHGGRSPGRTG